MSKPTDQTERPDTAACDEVAPYLSAYVDGELTPAMQAMVTAHIATCFSCARKAQRYRDIGRQIASLPSTSPSPEVFERIQAAIVQRGPNPVVREQLQPAEESPTTAIIRLLSPKVVYPQEPEQAAAEAEGSPSTSAPRLLPRTPFQRRSLLLRSGLPALVAMLLIALTVAVFNGLPHGSHSTNPIVRDTGVPTPASDALRQTASTLHTDAALLAFTPLSPRYLPAGAQFVGATISPNASVPKTMRTLAIIWTLPQQDGLIKLTLFETLDGQGRGMGLLGCQSASAAFDGQWLAWALPGAPVWQALTCDTQRTSPAVGQVHLEANAAGQSPANKRSTSARGSNSPVSSVSGQSTTQVDLAFIAQPANVSDANSVSAAVQAMRLASLSIDSSYQTQEDITARIGAQPQSYSELFLHFSAQASDGKGGIYAISGQTNESVSRSVNNRRAWMEIVTTGADTTDIVSGATSIRLNNLNNTYANAAYPVRTGAYLPTGQDGEPGSSVMELLLNTASLMQAGIVWVVADTVTHNVTYHNHMAYQLVVVNAPTLTTIYVDAATNQVIGVQMAPSMGGGGGAGAPPTQLMVSGGCSTMPNCSILYTDLWWGAATESFSLTPPAGYTQATTPIVVGFQCEQ